MKRIIILMFMIATLLSVAAQDWQLRVAKSKIEYGDYKEAAYRLRPLADGGNAEAQYLAAILFFNGYGVIKSETQAVKYLKMSAAQGYEDAIIQLFLYFDKKNMKKEAFTLIKNACEEYKKPIFEIALAGWYIEGQGTAKDIEQGWKILYKVRKTEGKDLAIYTHESFNKQRLDDQTYPILEQMTKLHDKLCDYLLDKYCVVGEEETMIDKIMREFGDEYSEPQWTDNLASKYIEKMNTFSQEMLIKTYNLLLGQRKATVFQCFVVGYMAYHGLGTEQNLTVAKTTANLIAKYIKKDSNPFMYNFVEEIRKKYGLEQPRQTVQSAQNKPMMTATCMCPQIAISGHPHAEWRKGTLDITVAIKLKAMNKCLITSSDVHCYIDKRRKNGSSEIIGLNTVGQANNALMPGTLAYVHIYFRGVASHGSLDSAKVLLQCNYGKGYIDVKNVEW